MKTEVLFQNIENIINFFIKYCLIIISIIIGIIGVISIFVTAYFSTTYNTASEVTFFKFSFGIIEIILSLLFLSIIIFIFKKITIKIPAKYLLSISLVFMLVIFISWIYLIKLEPIDDQKRIHEMAIDMLNDRIGLYFVQPMYLFLYPYQLGIVFFVSVFYKIFGQNFIIFQYVNCIFSVINLFLLYLISKEIFEEDDIKKIVNILLMGFGLYFMFYNVYFYGNIVGLSYINAMLRAIRARSFGGRVARALAQGARALILGRDLRKPPKNLAPNCQPIHLCVIGRGEICRISE